MAGYDAYELADRIKKALGEEPRNPNLVLPPNEDRQTISQKIAQYIDKYGRFGALLWEAFARDKDEPVDRGQDPPEPTIVFQDTSDSTTDPRLTIDIVSAERTPEFGEGVDDYQYSVYCTVSRTVVGTASLSSHIPKDFCDPNDLIQGSQVMCARTMRAVERFFATQLQPEDGFVLLSIESIVSGSFEIDDGTRALSTLQMQIVLT